MNIKTIKYLLLLFPILHMKDLIAQSIKNIDRNTEMKVGEDFMPPSDVSIMRFAQNQPNWKELEDKIILFDFFATNCGSCIQAMPKMQKIKDELGDRVEIFSVTKESKKVLDDFFLKNRYLIENKVNLPVIYEDRYLNSIFPHTTEPHIVWIYKGKIRAVTFSDFVKEENILKLHKDGFIKLPLKDDFGVSETVNQFENKGNFKAGAWFTKFQEGVNAQALDFQVDSLTGQLKSTFYNLPIFVALLSTWSKIQPPNFVVKGNRVIWKVRDSTMYDYFTPGIGYEVFRSEFGVCYERYDEVKRADVDQAKVVLNDLHHFLGIKTYFSKKKMKCIVLQKTPKSNMQENTFDVVKQQGFEGSGTLAFWLDYSNKFPPLVDEVKSTELIYLTEDNFDTLEKLNLQLAQFGIHAKEDYKEVDVFVVEEM